MNLKSNSFLFLYLGLIVMGIIITNSLVHRKTNLESNASKSTTLAFVGVSPVTTGTSVSLNVTLNPGNNYVAYVQLVADYDSSKLVPGSTPIVPGTIPGTNPPQQFGIFDGPTNN